MLFAQYSKIASAMLRTYLSFSIVITITLAAHAAEKLMQRKSCNINVATMLRAPGATILHIFSF